MDSDDISLPVRCERQAAEFEKDEALDILSCAVTEFSASPDAPTGARTLPGEHEEICRFSKKRTPFNHPAVMYRKRAVLKACFLGFALLDNMSWTLVAFCLLLFEHLSNEAFWETR